VRAATKRREASTLLIYGLSRSVHNIHIEEFLREFHGKYILQWVDVENVLVIFDSPAIFVTARDTLASGPYKTKPYIDSNSNLVDGNGHLLLGPSGSASASASTSYVLPARRPPQDSVAFEDEEGKSEDKDFKPVVAGAKKVAVVNSVLEMPAQNPWKLLEDKSESEDDDGGENWEDLIPSNETKDNAEAATKEEDPGV